jgi:uncharacterized membrane protein
MRVLSPWMLVLLATLPLIVASLYVRRERPGFRRVVPLLMRILAVALLVLAAAGVQFMTSGTGMDVVFVVDASDSVGDGGREETESFVESALSRANADDRAGIVLVGGEAVVERGLQSGLRTLTRESVVETGASSLEAGILRAISLFDTMRERRIVLLSDGQETSGSVLDAARIAADAGISVSTVPLAARAAAGEVFVRRIDAPTEVRVDQAHEFSVVIAATESADATVTVLRDDTYYGESRVDLAPGDNVVAFQGVFAEEGVHSYRVRVESRRDPLPMNNEAEVFVRAVGEPLVLYVSPSPAPQIIRALAGQGIATRVVTSDRMPGDVDGLVPYDAVIFDNVPAFELSVPRMEAVESYVRDTGGGFIMIGGDTSFGAGGYYGTPIERALPVDMDVTSSMRVPSLAMVFVIDKSGSMGSIEVNGQSKLDLVKEAVIASVEIMNAFYTVGVLAFDADYEWTVPLTEAGNRAQIAEDLSRLASGGGTVLEGALREAHATLAGQEAAVKHLIVLSDGLTADAEFESIVGDMAEDSITVSTVSVGSSSDRELMRQIAEWGGGRSYHTTDSRSVPRIFTNETTIVSRNLIVEETFVPTVRAASPILQGIDLSGMPPLRGFVLTYGKLGGQQVLTGATSDPLLSTWQYGLGRTAAFTSDLRAKWAQAWLDWPGYQQFLAQLVRWTQRAESDSNLAVSFRQSVDSTRVAVDALEPDGSFRNLLELSALVRPPAGDSFVVDLPQVAPGRYEASIPSTSEGAYLVTVFGDTEVPRAYGFGVPYAREYIQFETDYELMSLVAEAGGGSVLGVDRADEVFVPSSAGRTYGSRLWMWLVIAAVGLLLFELVTRKLLLPVGSVTPVSSAGSGAEGPTDEEAGGQGEGEAARAEGHQPTYEELRRQVAEAYRRTSRTRQEFRRWHEGGEHNPVAERKIHIARKRRE